MKPLRTLLSLLLALPLLTVSPAFAAPKQLDIQGNIMSAETNKPVAGAKVACYARGDKGVADKPAATAVSDAQGRFRAKLVPGFYAWVVKAQGFGLFEGSVSVSAGRQPELLSAYLNKPAEITGRIVDGNARPVAGVTISAGTWISAVSGPDGRFRISGLGSHGFDPSLAQPGWVLGKTAYIQLAAGQTKDMGDTVIRKAASLRVKVTVSGNGAARSLNKIAISMEGPGIYRSGSCDKNGAARLASLPPGRYTVSTSDERLRETRQELEIAEGENRDLALTTEVKPPALNIQEYRDVFLPGKAVKLRVTGLWVEKGEAVISSIAAGALLNGSADLRKPDAIPAGALKRVISIPVPFKAQRNSHSRSARIPIPGLAAGAYLLEVRGKGASTRFAFLVTRLGLVAKTSPNETLLFATDLVSGVPLAGVEIHALPRGAHVTSGPDGLVVWSGAGTAPRLAGKSGDSLAFLDLPSREEGTGAAALKGYVYTDRPVYRPGQTVFYKGVVRQRSGEEYRLPTLGTVHVVTKDDNDKTVCEGDATATGTGSFSGECALPPVPSLGDYRIIANGNGETWQGWFRVLEYRKPEFEVTAVADRRFLVAGDTALMKVTGRYYFGAPVAGAKVVWRIYSQPAWGLNGDNDDDGGYDDEHRSGGYSDFIGEGESTLDANGELSLPVVAKSHDMPLIYTLEADVSDAAARQVSASATVTVVPSLVALNVKAASYLAKPGQAVDITLRAAAWEGGPKALPVKLVFERQTYDKQSRSYGWSAAGSSDLSTATDGSARTRFAFPRPGYWQVRAETADEAGRKATAATTVWVWKEGYAWEGSYRELEAEFDRKSYKPGETARLIVRAPMTGGSLLLTQEGRDIQSRQVVPLKGMVEVVEIPVSESQAPFIHVSAIAVGGGRFFSRTLPLRVDYQPGKLALAIRAEKPVYGPGDPVTLTISSKVAGKPVPAELSLAIVDEAIFAVAKERPDDIWQFFRGNREHLVTTLHSFPRVYLGGAAKGAATGREDDDGLKGLKVRKTFKDTAAWFPFLTATPDGSATARFTLPDNLTTWRATAMGHTQASEFGSAREKFIARLDLMARLAPPRFLVAGDELRIPGIITSMTGNEQQASGRFEAAGLTLLGDTTFSGSLAAKGTLRRDMTLRADRPGSAVLRLLAKGATGGDAMELALPVLPRAISREVSAGMVLRENAATTDVTLPAEALPGTAELKLTFAPTIAASLNSAITRLVEFPYGCVEQTLSRFIPAVHARALLKQAAWQPDPETSARLPLVIAEGIRRLEEMQHEDGGWGWWKNDTTSPAMTAHAVYGLGLARQAGVAVPQDLLKRGLASLEQQAATARTDDLPRICRALAVNNMRNTGLEQRIAAAWKELAVAERLAYAEALGFAGQKGMVAPLLAELKGQVQNEGEAAYIRDEEAESWWYGWRWGSSAVETTSSLLSLLVRQEPADPLASRLARFLARRQSGGWWHTTTASAAAIIALADYVAASGEAGASYSARLTLNGNQVAAYRVEDGRLTAGAPHITVPATALKNGINALKLEKSGPGAAYLSASLNYLAAPEAARSAEGLKLERALYRIATVKDGSTWRREYTPLKPGEALHPGDDLEVRLIVENRKALEYVIVEDRLPAGFESRETDRDPRFSGESAYLGWYSHRERRDERLAFFITTLPAGRHEFRHVIYPELAGRMMALPAAAWPMYQPEMRGESAPWGMEVTGR